MKDTGIRLSLGSTREWKGDDGHDYRSEQWTITGGEVDPSWRPKAQASEAGWEPSCRFTLYVIDGEVDERLVSYGGVVWPVAWTTLFETRGQGHQRCVARCKAPTATMSAAVACRCLARDAPVSSSWTSCAPRSTCS